MASEVAMEQEERLPPVHPGEVLLEDFMKPLGLSQYRLAQELNVPALRISQIVHGKRAVTADTALRLRAILAQVQTCGCGCRRERFRLQKQNWQTG